ncbi:unnamed protein product [Polarella glacialis]|uniref:Uncharacterized protein n=1 Tax=Polarella glacialis TaxID=89957 RepID=A0A813LJL0_POLGL|nr:unnamed protein product [Polarella glacialis]CAE8730580.1 unnamed protein product [Polarella glacialis]
MVSRITMFAPLLSPGPSAFAPVLSEGSGRADFFPPCLSLGYGADSTASAGGLGGAKSSRQPRAAARKAAVPWRVLGASLVLKLGHSLRRPRRVAVSAFAPQSDESRVADLVECTDRLVERRSIIFTAAAAALVSTADSVHADDEGRGPAELDPTIFVGRYTDPNHPGGYRQITLLDTFQGELRDAKVEGGGGLFEPKFFTLKATVGRKVLDKGRPPRLTITIDFTPKGGPANFPGVWDKNGITFLGDGNHWPKREREVVQ